MFSIWFKVKILTLIQNSFNYSLTTSWKTSNHDIGTRDSPIKNRSSVPSVFNTRYNLYSYRKFLSFKNTFVRLLKVNKSNKMYDYCCRVQTIVESAAPIGAIDFSVLEIFNIRVNFFGWFQPLIYYDRILFYGFG